MITLHSNFPILLVCSVYFVVCPVLSFPVETNFIEETLLQNLATGVIENKDNVIENSSSSNTRVKRSKSFKEAGETSQLKVVQQLAQLIKNYFAKKPMGGRHPFDPVVPVIFGKLVRTKFFSLLDAKSETS